MSAAELIFAILAILVLGTVARRISGRGPSLRHRRTLGVFLCLAIATGLLAHRHSGLHFRPGPHRRGRQVAFDSESARLGAAANRAAAREKKRSEPAKTTAQAAGGDDETRVAKLDSAEDVAHERPLESEDSPTQDVVIPPGRPAWVESEPAEAGDVYTWPVSSGVQLSKQACRRALDEKLQAATRQYLDQILGRNNASAWVDYDTPYIRAHLLRPENIYHEVIQTSVGPVHQSHGLLEFDDSFRQQSQERWSELRATSRLLQVGLGAGLVLGVVGAFFAFFRLDTATRGYYTRRLQLAVAGAILTMIAAGVLLARCIPWI